MMTMKHVGAGVAVAMLLGAGVAQAATPEEAATKAVLQSPKFAKGQAQLASDYDRIVGDVIKLTEIAAPPFAEGPRAQAYLAMLKAEGLEDTEMDAEGNVMGLLRATALKPGEKAPLIVIAAHLDTVFPAGTNVKVRREGDMLLAPGIGDDTCSLAANLGLLRAIRAGGFQLKSDILFVGNVGEEGPGDLRGVRYIFNKGKYAGRIASFISFEPGPVGQIVNGGTGSKRYKVTFKGPGGHSMGDFGLVNPAYAMGAAMVAFGQTKVPAQPLTVYNVGLVEGGTSVNSIPFSVAMTVDMRSNGKAELDALDQHFLGLLPKAVAGENAARSTAKGPITYEAKLVGERPVGTTPVTARIIRVAQAAAKAQQVAVSFSSFSTDSNVPMSKGIEAVTLGSGFASFRAHSLEEGLKLDKPADLRNFGLNLATVLVLAGAK